MASLRVLALDHEGRPIQFDTWLDDLQLYQLTDSRDIVCLTTRLEPLTPLPPQLTVRLAHTETSVVAVGAACCTPCTPFFEGCFPSPLAPSYASSAAVDVLGAEDVGAASSTGKRRSSKGKGGRGGGSGRGGGGGGSSGSGGGSGGGGKRQQQQRRSETPSPQQLHTREATHSAPLLLPPQRRLATEFGDEAERPRCAELLRSGVDIFDLYYDAILAAMYALSVSAEGECYLCVPPNPWIEAVALGASESALPGTAPAEALHTFMLDSGASRCFFCDSTTLTPLSAPEPVRLADPSGGPVVAYSSTILPCLVVPSGSLSCLHLPSFSTNLVSTVALQEAMVTTTTLGGQRVSICTCTRTGRHLATFTRRPGSSLYTLATEPPQVAASAQVSASGQNLMWHHRIGHPSLPHLRGMHSRLLVSGLPRSLPDLSPLPAPPCLPCIEGRQRVAPHSSFPPTTAPLQNLHMDVKGEVPNVLIPWIHAVRLQLRERFRQDLPVLRVHSDRGGEFSSDLLRDFCRGEGILQSFTLPASPQQNGIAERHIGKVMEFYHPTSRRVIPSQDVTFDESVPFYRLFPYRSAPLPPPPLFLATGPPPVDPLPPQGPAPSGVSQVDPLPVTVLVEVAVDSFAARGAASGGGASSSAEPGGAESEGAGSRGAERAGAEPVGVEPRGAEPEGVEPGGAESEGAESGVAEPRGTASSGGSVGASPRLSPRPEPLSPQQLREWFAQCTRLRNGAAGAGDSAAGDTGAGGVGATRLRGAAVTAGAGGTGGAAAAGLEGARTRGTRAARNFCAGGAGAGGPAESRGAWAGGCGAGGTGAGGAGSRGTGAGGAGAEGAGAVDPGAGGAGGGSAQVLGVPSSTALTPPLLCPPLDYSQPPLQPASPLPAPSPYSDQTCGPIERREPASRPASPVRTGRRVPRLRPPSVPGTHAMALRPSSVPLRVPLPPPPESSLSAFLDLESDLARAASPTLVDFAATCRLDYATALVADFESGSPPSVGGECALGTDVLEDRQEDFECLAAAVPRFASMLLALEGDLDAPDIPTPRSYAEAITGPYSSQWQTAMDAEMASWKSTGTYVDAVPPSWANIVNGMWIFRVKRPSGSPPAFKHMAAQRDYELHSLDFSTAFLQCSLHEEI
ncbi:unnamed protein product [Closterium sp. NIES-53]